MLLQKMMQNIRLLYILLLFNLFSLYTAKAFPQYTKQEDTDEDTDDIYDEEDNGSSTTEAEEEEENEEDHTPIDKDELEDAIARKKLAERLGVKNFSSAAIAVKASNYVVSYLTGGFLRPPTPKPRRRIKPATNPKVITTKKYRIYKNSTSSPLKPVNLAGNSTAINTRTFVINVPHGMNGTGGGTIEINIPMEAMQNSEDDAHVSQMTISAPDDQNVKNIEAAIMEALIIAQQMTGMSMMANASVNGTEVFELDISKNMIQNLTEIRTIAEETQSTTEILQEIEIPEILTTEVPVEVKPTKRRRRRTTTLAPDDVLAVGPATGVIVSQIRSGQLPTFLWKSIIKLANSKYMQIAVDAVECAVFYECPNDAELGTLTKGAKF